MFCEGHLRVMEVPILTDCQGTTDWVVAFDLNRDLVPREVKFS